jgi:hypothetical protein
MTFLRKIEDFHNWASDTRFVWFPFLCLKPKPQEFLRFKKLLLMSFCFGFYFGFFLTIRKSFQPNSNFFESLPSNLGFSVFGFFVWFNFVTAPLWNRRANKLLNHQESQN